MAFLTIYPSDWESEQIKAYDKTYDEIVKGVIKWTDLIPSLNLPGNVAKGLNLAVKMTVHYGDRGRYAFLVKKFHDHFAQGMSLTAVYYMFETVDLVQFSEKDPRRNLVIVMTLYKSVYGVDYKT
jgi:hypothetical protein